MPTFRNVCRVAALCAVTILCSSVRADDVAAIIYVDDDAPEGGDGTSWVQAYRFLQDALLDIEFEPGRHEIRVGPGRYRPDQTRAVPDGTGDRATTFALRDGIALVGGYAGMGAPDPSVHDPDTYRTVLTGDLAGDDDALSDNAWHVVTARDVGPATELVGMVITGGFGMPRGGGLLCEAGSLRVRRCVFQDNGAQYGAAVSMVDGSAPRFEECVFRRNAAIWRGGAVLAFMSAPVFDRCAFERNTSTHGGAIDLKDSSALVFDTTFVDNAAAASFFEGHGGAVVVAQGSSSFIRCIFRDNLAEESGGAVYADDDVSTFLDCVFELNSARAGGGIAADDDALPLLVNTRLCLNLPDAISGPWDDQGDNDLCCGGDLDGDGVVGTADLIGMMSNWGPCDECDVDLDGDGVVGAVDLMHLMAQWGPCQ